MARWEISFGQLRRSDTDAWDQDLIAEHDGEHRATYTSRASGPAIALVGQTSLTAGFARAWAENAATRLRGEIKNGEWPADGVPTVMILDDASVRSIAAMARELPDAVAPTEGDVLLTFDV